jgi:Protein of unknown function (Hypoth_ymh)
VANVILTLFPTADRLIEATDVEIERAVLLRVAECCADPMRCMVARDGVTIELFERGGYDYDVRRRTEVEKAIARAWKRLEDTGLIEEPDFENGKNGFRVPSERGHAAAESFDFAAAITRGTFSRKMFHPLLPDAAWRAFRAGDHDTAVFEAFKAVEVAVRKKGLGINGIVETDYGIELMKKAFDPNAGPLSDKKATRPRRTRRCELFTGALGDLRNPKAHHDPAVVDPLAAVEEMMVAGALLRIVDRA